MASDPLVSILIPVFNGRETLGETLRSAFASTYRNTEILIVDDGSSDDSQEIAKQFAAADSRVRLLSQDHKGVSAALNLGLRQVRGDFVARLDADDLWHPQKLEKQLQVMTADPDIALVYTFVRLIDGHGTVLSDGPRQQMPPTALCQCLIEGIVGGGSSALIRTSAIKGAAYQEDLELWEDLLLHLRIAESGNFSVVPEYLTAYRVRPQSASHDVWRSLDNWQRARDLIDRDFEQVPLMVRRWADSRRWLDFAAHFQRLGKSSDSARCFAKAMALDPARTLKFMSYRMGRRVRAEEASIEPAPQFNACDPSRTYRPTHLGHLAAGRRLREFDAARNAFLAQLSQQLRSLSRRPQPEAVQGTNPAPPART